MKSATCSGGPGDEAAAGSAGAPLEEAVAGRAIGERGSRLLGEALTAEQVFSSDDPRARALVREALAELAVHVANLAILINPARIAVGGGLMGSGRRASAALGARLSDAVRSRPTSSRLASGRMGRCVARWRWHSIHTTTL